MADILKCALCKGILRDPYECKNCHSCFCKKCKGEKCRICKNNEFEENKELKKLLLNY